MQHNRPSVSKSDRSGYAESVLRAALTTPPPDDIKGSKKKPRKVTKAK